jgi:hypothetical protein
MLHALSLASVRQIEVKWSYMFSTGFVQDHVSMQPAGNGLCLFAAKKNGFTYIIYTALQMQAYCSIIYVIGHVPQRASWNLRWTITDLPFF